MRETLRVLTLAILFNFIIGISFNIYSYYYYPEKVLEYLGGNLIDTYNYDNVEEIVSTNRGGEDMYNRGANLIDIGKFLFNTLTLIVKGIIVLPYAIVKEGNVIDKITFIILLFISTIINARVVGVIYNLIWERRS